MSPTSFAPSGSVSVLKKRAHLLNSLRAFFYEHNVCEVDVPVLGRCTVTDPFIEALKVDVGSGHRYLQTSPEYYMKRLLAAGMSSLYGIGKAFRADEKGRRHRCEFTLLEWYSVGMDDRELMNQLRALLAVVAPKLNVITVSYGALFEQQLGLCPHSCDSAALKHLAKQHANFDGELASKSAWLDLLFSHCIEPTLTDGFTLVCDYPVEQSALAKVVGSGSGQRVARRFELFAAGIELANGYWELTDAQEQRRRFEADQSMRQRLGLPKVAIDEQLMAALEYGLPPCAGVAMGVDRLLMVLTGSRDIAQVMPFAQL